MILFENIIIYKISFIYYEILLPDLVFTINNKKIVGFHMDISDNVLNEFKHA